MSIRCAMAGTRPRAGAPRRRARAPIAARYGLDLEIVNEAVDPTFRFMSLDWDGRIRMDCSSPYAMAPLIALKDRFDIAFGNDPDADRHGIVTRTAGLMNPNHYLAAAISYLFTQRTAWRRDAAVGKNFNVVIRQQHVNQDAVVRLGVPHPQVAEHFERALARSDAGEQLVDVESRLDGEANLAGMAALHFVNGAFDLL